MAQILASNSEVWVDERGKKVIIANFFSKLYTDEESRELSRVYNAHKVSGDFVLSSLADAGLEYLVRDLFGICKAVGEFVGFEKSELEHFCKMSQETGAPEYLESREFMRRKWIKGKEVYFPTEGLLENQRVEKYPTC